MLATFRRLSGLSVPMSRWKKTVLVQSQKSTIFSLSSALLGKTSLFTAVWAVCLTHWEHWDSVFLYQSQRDQTFNTFDTKNPVMEVLILVCVVVPKRSLGFKKK